MNELATAPVLVRTTADRVATLTLNRPRQYDALLAALLAALDAGRVTPRAGRSRVASASGSGR